MKGYCGRQSQKPWWSPLSFYVLLRSWHAQMILLAFSEVGCNICLFPLSGSSPGLYSFSKAVESSLVRTSTSLLSSPRCGLSGPMELYELSSHNNSCHHLHLLPVLLLAQRPWRPRWWRMWGKECTEYPKLSCVCCSYITCPVQQQTCISILQSCGSFLPSSVFRILVCGQ